MTVLKHTAAVLVTQNYCKHSEQDLMTPSAAERWEERSTDAVGQRAAALAQSVHNVICDKEAVNSSQDKERVSKLICWGE